MYWRNEKQYHFKLKSFYTTESFCINHLFWLDLNFLYVWIFLTFTDKLFHFTAPL